MKYKTNLFTVCIFLWTLFFYQNIAAVLSISQYKSDSFFQKPYFTQDEHVSFSCIFSGGFASQAYNTQGTKVPFLQQFGPENLLKKFTDTSLLYNNTESFGLGALDGDLHVREIILSCYKNMNHGFFIEAATVIQDLFMNKISVNFIEPSTQLTVDQINYLQKLQQLLPETIDTSGMFTTVFYVGYSKTFVNFTHIDFIDLTIKTGCMSPQSMTDTQTTILQFPFYENMNFGYPVITAASFGFLDWITIGCNGSVIPWQAATKTVPLNNSSSGNNLLIPQSGLATIQRGPLLTSSIYFEADHFHPGLSGTIAYCYTKSCSYTIMPINTTQFSHGIAHESGLVKGWSLGSVYMQFDVDFASHSQPNAPIITIFCNVPIAGKLCPKTTIFGSSCSLQISYDF